MNRAGSRGLRGSRFGVALFFAVVVAGGCHGVTGICIDSRKPLAEHPLDGTDTVAVELLQGGSTVERRTFPTGARQVTLDPVDVQGPVVVRIEGLAASALVARGQTFPFDPTAVGSACVPAYVSRVGHFAPTPTMLQGSALGSTALSLDPSSGTVLVPYAGVDTGLYAQLDGHFTTGPTLPRSAPGGVWVRLDDGSVVVVGGQSPGTLRWSPASPASGFTMASDLPATPVVGHAVVALQAAAGAPACFLLVGGASDSTSAPSDPMAQRGCIDAGGALAWDAFPLPRALRDQAAVALADGTVLLVGGNAGSAAAPVPVADAWIVDPIARSVTTHTLFEARFDAAVASAEDGGVGYAVAAGGTGVSGLLSSVEVFVQGGAGFVASGLALAVPVTGALGVAVQGSRVLVAGGRDGSGVARAEAVLYDPALYGRWVPIAPMPVALGRPIGAPIGDDTLFVGGVDDAGFARVWVFNPP